MRTIVVVSGGFDPLHSGHLRLLTEAKALGDALIVALNSDDWLTRKKGKPFLRFAERFELVSTLRLVDAVLPFDDSDGTARNALRLVKQNNPEDRIVFANGGDRTATNIPEMDVDGVEFVFDVGGNHKANSSSWLLDAWRKHDITERVWGRYEVMEANPFSKIKILKVEGGKFLSMQRHAHRTEHWVVVKGQGRLYSDDTSVTLTPGSLITIPVRTWHQLYAFTYMEILEVQVGDPCVESDIERRSLT